MPPIITCRVKVVPVFFCLLFLCACAHTAPRPKTSSFAATGLTARPDETAEEILLRAHQLDARAMALAAVGYGRGLDGFPRDKGLAFRWARQVLQMELFQANAFLQILLRVDEPLLPKTLAVSAAWCEQGRKSGLAPRFRQAGLFDIDQRCREVAAVTKEVPGRSESTREGCGVWPDALNMRDLMRKRRAAAGNAKEERWLNTVLPKRRRPDLYLFDAATTHAPETESPDWSAERLLDFMAVRPVESEELREEVKQTLLARLTANPAQALELIRLAHNGDPAAMRSMARNYSQGDMGFVRDSGLARAWLLHGAQARDPVCMVLLAIEAYAPPQTAQSWAWAKLADERGDASVRGLAARLMGMIEGRADADVMRSARPALTPRAHSASRPHTPRSLRAPPSHPALAPPSPRAHPAIPYPANNPPAECAAPNIN